MPLQAGLSAWGWGLGLGEPGGGWAIPPRALGATAEAEARPQGLSLNSCARLTQQRPSRWGWDFAQGSNPPSSLWGGAPVGHSGRPQTGQQRLVVMEEK